MCAWAAFFCYCYFGCMPKKGPMLEDSSLWPGTLMKNVSFFSLLSAHVTMLPSEPAFPCFHSVLKIPKKSHGIQLKLHIHVWVHLVNACKKGHLYDVEFFVLVNVMLAWSRMRLFSIIFKALCSMFCSLFFGILRNNFSFHNVQFAKYIYTFK